LVFVAAAPFRASSSELSAIESLIGRDYGVRAFLRSRATRVRWALSLVLPALFLGRELFRKGAEWRTLGPARVLACLLLVTLLGMALNSALRLLPTAGRAHRARSLLTAIACCAPGVLCLLQEAPMNADDLNGGFAVRSLACFAYGSALAAPSFALLWVFDRTAHVPYHVWALGVGVVTLLANSILLVHCPISNRAHLLAGHFSIGLVWLLLVSLWTWRADRAR
jgi:hypothetical protein